MQRLRSRSGAAAEAPSSTSDPDKRYVAEAVARSEEAERARAIARR